MKWHSFLEVVTDVTAKFKKIKTSDYHSKGRYKIIDQGKEAIAGYTDDANLVNGQLLPILIFGDHTRVLKYEDDPIALGADGAKALWVNPKLANARYVYYYLRSIQIKEAGYSRHFKFLKEVEIPIPFKDGASDLNAQIRIAHLLGKVKGLIAQRKQHLQQLDDLLKSVFLELFGDPARNENGWEVLKFSELFAMPPKIGTTKPASGDVGISVVRVGEIGGLEVRFDKCATVQLSTDEYSKCKVEVGDILLARAIGSQEHLGKASLITKLDRPIAFDSHVMRIRFDPERIVPLFAYFWLRSSGGRALFLKASGKTSVQFNINAKQISSIGMPLPPKPIQDEFATFVEKIEALMSRYQRSLADLEALYGALSQKAFKGELDLSRVPRPADQAQQVGPAPLPEDIVKPTEVLNRVVQFAPPESRSELLARWFNRYLANTSPDASLGSREFLESAWQTLQETLLETEGETPALGLADYDALKGLVFAALEGGALTQTFDAESNRVSLQRRTAEWGTF